MRRRKVIGAVRRAMLRAAVVAIGAMFVMLPTTSAHAASIDRYVGWYCWNNSTLGNYRENAACVWMNVDHTNDRIRAYAEANGIFEGAEGNPRWISNVALRTIRLQKMNADSTWRDVAGTTVNDLDGWQRIDRVDGVLWPCSAAGGVFRAVVEFSIRQEGRISTTMVRTGSHTYYYAYDC